MTEKDYIKITAREDAPFAFHRVRGADETRFLPEAPVLHFASREADTLTVGAPEGFFQSGDAVRVAYLGQTVFRGALARSTTRRARGDLAGQEAVFEGPWGAMARLVYRQYWRTRYSYTLSSRLVLNQHQSGSPQNLNSELREILTHGAVPCGYTVGSVSVSAQTLPFDECRDITVADALRRELRFFPRAVVRFDYAAAKPAVSVTRAAADAEDAAYVASVPLSARDIEYDENPITGVDLEIEAVGDGWREISHQRAGNALAGNPDCLYATLRVAAASSSTVKESFNSVTEPIPSDLDDVDWWREKHPRLQNVAANAITITEGKRVNASEQSVFARISANTAGELEAAGLRYRVEEFTCRATIDDGEDKEEGLLLSLKFLTTNATTQRYEWVVSSSHEEGETVPAGLAAALLAERAGRLRAERMTIRLGDALPKLGDACDGLLLQSFDVDCDALTAELRFGAPEFLSPEDMASLLSGFRNRTRAASALSRASGKTGDDDPETVQLGGIPPVEASDWAPGTTAKKTFKLAPGGDDEGGGEGDEGGDGEGEGGADEKGTVVVDVTDTPRIELASAKKRVTIDLAQLPEDCESGVVALHYLKYNDSHDTEHVYHGLFCGDIDLTDIKGKGKTIERVSVVPFGGDPGGVTITFTYTDETTDTITLYNGKKGENGYGQDGLTPEIETRRNENTVDILVDGEVVETIEDGHTPVITAEKNDGVTTIFADGVPIAQISDGEGAWTAGTCITDLRFELSGGKLKAVLTRSPCLLPADAGEAMEKTVEVCDAKDVDVVTSESYSTGSHQFTNTRRRVTVLASASADGQTVFTATPHSEEGD